MQSVQQCFSWSVMQINRFDFVPENAPSYQLITAYRTSLTTLSSPYVNLPRCSFHQRWEFHERVKLDFWSCLLPLIILLKRTRCSVVSVRGKIIWQWNLAIAKQGKFLSLYFRLLFIAKRTQINVLVHNHHFNNNNNHFIYVSTVFSRRQRLY